MDSDRVRAEVVADGLFCDDVVNMQAGYGRWMAGGLSPVEVTREESFSLLDRVGVLPVCAYLEAGNLPGQVARHYGVSPSHLQEWLDSRLGPDEVAAVRQALAEALQERSLYALVNGLSNPDAHPGLVKALSDRLAELAGALDPSRWRSRPPPPEVSMQAVSINITMPEVNDEGRPVLSPETAAAAAGAVAGSVAGASDAAGVSLSLPDKREGG